MQKPKNQLNKKRLPKCGLVSCRHTLTHTHNDREGKFCYKIAAKCCFLKLNPEGITTGWQRLVRHVRFGRVKCYYLWGLWMRFNEGVCAAGLMKKKHSEFDTILRLKFEIMSSAGKERWVGKHF